MTEVGEQKHEPLSYTRLFDPQTVESSGDATESDLDDASVYVFDDEDLVLAINVAIATQRCLLLFGPAGSGKSSLAANVARVLGVPYYEQTMTSRVVAEDLLWTTDLVRRLNDAQVNALEDDHHYRKKGVLWRAFEAGAPNTEGKNLSESTRVRRTSCVVLLDEIDKAEAEVTDGLLVPLDARSFRGPDGVPVRSVNGQPLVIITSNNERELSKPFLRRCVVATLKGPETPGHLVAVATAKLGPYHNDLYIAVERLFLHMRAVAGTAAGYVPNTAEFLDAVRSCREMGIMPGSPEWYKLASFILAKEQPGS